jgi:hypothetical protein
MAINGVLKMAEWSQETWRKALDEFPGLSSNFHLRACSDCVTVVSTHPEKPMLGCYCKKKGGKSNPSLSTKLAELGKVNHLNADSLSDFGFKCQGLAKNGLKHNRVAEDCLQAQLINDLTDKGLARACNFRKLFEVETLRFVGSEMILYEKGDEHMLRPDVVALGDGKLFLIEMKTADSMENAVEQVKRYLDYYRSKKEYYDLINLYLGAELSLPEKRNWSASQCTATGRTRLQNRVLSKEFTFLSIRTSS